MTPTWSVVLPQVDAQLDEHHEWRRQLSGGEQNGAHLIADEHGVLTVLTWRPAGSRAVRLLQAAPLVAEATARGWPAARWLAAGPPHDGGAFVIQEYLPGDPILHLDEASVQAVIAANATIARGCRIRDLADLYRQSFSYPSRRNTGARLLVDAGIAAVGPAVFARCAVAVTYDHLAWWTEPKSVPEFDQACQRLGRLFESLDQNS